MKQLLVYSFTFLMIFGCGTERHLPKEMEAKTEFGMPLNEFLSFKNSKVEKQETGMGFRHVYYEEITGKDIAYIVYYFDADGEKPLYEVLIGYHDQQKRDAVARQLLGEPNSENNTEWQLKPEKGYEIKAWTYKDKLIITALIPETEWYEDTYGN